MSTTHMMASLREPETYRFADMQGVLHDLVFVTAICNRRLRYQGNHDIGTVEVEAIEAGALVRYGRCFDGVRHAFRLAPLVDELPAALRAAHKRFLILRDKHIAHSVNDWELNEAQAQLRRDDKTDVWDVVAIAAGAQRIVGLGTDDLSLLRDLASGLADRVAGEIEIERQRLLEWVKSSIPIEELKRRALEDEPRMPGAGALDKRRAR
jgi:hypothetical protein